MMRPQSTNAPQRAATPGTEALYRMLPPVHQLLGTAREGDAAHPRRVRAIRSVLDRLRAEIGQGLLTASSLQQRIDDLPRAIDEEMNREIPRSLRRVINATGVILHTNLGRAPLSQRAIENVSAIAAGYTNLEFDLDRGERGRRDVHLAGHLLALLSQSAGADLTETHSAIVVNNCAAATFLTLHALARGRHVLVSRGELVEIGGGFRIPEILEASGAILREVGTTNRTRLADYERAITPETALILHVHPSNFAMEGFVERVEIEELAALGKRAGIAVFADQGTGLVELLEPLGVRGEATMGARLTAGCDIVAASGDKLFGGPQCGLLIGRRELIEQIRRDPLYRTFRVDKLSCAALEGTLIEYLYGEHDGIPVLHMLRTPGEEIRLRCERIAGESLHPAMRVEVVPTESLIGGGTAPKSKLPGFALALQHQRMDVQALLDALRRREMPIVGRIEEDRVLLDLRTVEPALDALLAAALGEIANRGAEDVAAKGR